MKQSILVPALLCFVMFGCRVPVGAGSGSQTDFYGTDSRRAEMTFTTKVIVKFPGDPQQLLQAQFQQIALDAVDAQLSHMYGAFTQHTRPFNFVKKPGIPRGRPERKLLSVEKAGPTTVSVTYSYSDIAVFKKSMFSGSTSVTIPFLLPSDPVAIYSKGLVPLAEAKKIFAGDADSLEMLGTLSQEGMTQANLCTDLHYNTEGDYWYFWNPYQKGCPQATRDGMVKVSATLRPLNSTAHTAPDYKRLQGDNENGRVLRITYIVGIDSTFRRGDLGRSGFNKAFKLLTLGKGVLKDPSIAGLLTAGEKKLFASVDPSKDIVFTADTAPVDQRHRELHLDTPKFKVLMNMYLMEPGTQEFINQAVAGMRESDIFIYDGHSGLGGYLEVGELFGKRKTSLPTDKYQVFYFNGCSTFSYYNADYFDLKITPQDPHGTKNLDILTTGIGAPFTIGPGGDVWLIRGLVNAERPSWQSIIDTIYNVEPAESALTHVNGDE